MSNKGGRMSDYAYAWKNGPRWAWEFLYYRKGRSISLGASFIGFLRTLWLTLACGHISETCQECGKPYLLWWAPDDLYATVTGLEKRGGSYSPGLFCLDCFDRKAVRKGMLLRWKPEACK